MKTLYIHLGYYKTLIVEMSNSGKELNILKIDSINSGNNFLIGRVNKVDDFAEHLSVKLKSEFKKGLSNIVMILSNDFVIESLLDANLLDVKNKQKEIKIQAHKNKHLGLGGLNIMKIGKNSYNDMYLTTEFDSKRLNLILRALRKKGINIKQVVSPLNCSHHLARSVICPFEVINSSNGSSVIKSGILLVNVGLNRINYTLVHNNLPIEIREGQCNFVKLIDSMYYYGIPFIKIIRLLNLIGIEGLQEDNYTYKYQESAPNINNLILDSLDDDLDDIIDDSKIQENLDKPMIYLNEQSDIKNKRNIRLKEQNKEYSEQYNEEDSDLDISDEAYYKFDDTLREILSALKSESQKMLNYFSSNYNIKITNIIVVSSDIKCIDTRLINYLGLKGEAFEIQPEESLEVEDYSIVNMTDAKIGSQYAMIFGAILSNYVRGNIYE